MDYRADDGGTPHSAVPAGRGTRRGSQSSFALLLSRRCMEYSQKKADKATALGAENATECVRSTPLECLQCGGSFLGQSLPPLSSEPRTVNNTPLK